MYGNFRSIVLSEVFSHVCICLFVFGCVYFMSSRVHARAVLLSFPSRRYSYLGSPGGWDAPTGVLTLAPYIYNILLNPFLPLHYPWSFP